MIYGRFRAGETSAELTWIGGAPGPLRRGPATVTGPATSAAAGLSRPPAIGGRALAGQVIQGRSILGPAGVLRYPSTSLLRATPGSASVIPPATEADLPNRQGPCLRKPSPGTPLRRHKCLFPGRENKTYSTIEAVRTQKFKRCRANSRPGLYHPAGRRHHPSPTAVRDGKRSNSLPSCPTPGPLLRTGHRGRVVFD